MFVSSKPANETTKTNPSANSPNQCSPGTSGPKRLLSDIRTNCKLMKLNTPHQGSIKSPQTQTISQSPPEGKPRAMLSRTCDEMAPRVPARNLSPQIKTTPNDSVANAINKLIAYLCSQSADGVNCKAQHQQASTQATSEITRAIKVLASQLEEGGDLACAVKALTSQLKQAGELARAINSLISHLEQAPPQGIQENPIKPPTSSIPQAVKLNKASGPWE
ncbi:hypothetical protein PCASD_06317 [Puccinia coronata f. sp. avenae]|uniref:Uncharacterized protein n=1 Tax=Puccinia coronata f. sp. avenae TaxID=200324 RepID=A0A2N5V918_9BASI|nr:hypothetical protein PCASD_06317 [Puccinia coronata f. sp. avenae]